MAEKTNSLVVRIDDDGKLLLTQAAELRGISVSDYVRTVMVSQARREIGAASQQTMTLTPDEQLQFWTALQQEPRLTSAQCKLSAVMRGEK